MEFKFRKLTSGEDALFNNINVKSDEIPVCLETPNKNPKEKPNKSFGVFRSAYQLLNYIADTPIMSRCFFEVIRGSHAQKHYVDIDIDLVDDDFSSPYPHSIEEKVIISNQLVGIYTEALISIKPEIKLDDILTFNSHADNKRSFHIVVDRWFFPSATFNKELFQQVMERVPIQYHKYFDSGMYKSVQQFRILFSTKCGKNRFKILDPNSTWKLKTRVENDSMKMRELFYASLITEVTGNCTMLPFQYKDRIADVPSRYMCSSEINVVISLFRSNFKDHSSFDVLEPKNSLIPLKRRNPSYCEVCQRVHEAENPFIYVNFENKLFFNCRRNENSQLIGQLGTTDDGMIILESQVKVNNYKPPSIPSRPNISSFVDNGILNLRNENKEKSTTYPHLSYLSDEKINNHQKIIEEAKARYIKLKPKMSVDERLRMIHHNTTMI